MYDRDALHVQQGHGFHNTTLTASYWARSLSSFDRARYIPRETMPRIRIAAAIERKRMKQFLLDLVEAHLLEMEKKGLLPKEGVIALMGGQYDAIRPGEKGLTPCVLCSGS